MKMTMMTICLFCANAWVLLCQTTGQRRKELESLDRRQQPLSPLVGEGMWRQWEAASQLQSTGMTVEQRAPYAHSFVSEPGKNKTKTKKTMMWKVNSLKKNILVDHRWFAKNSFRAWRYVEGKLSEQGSSRRSGGSAGRVEAPICADGGERRQENGDQPGQGTSNLRLITEHHRLWAATTKNSFLTVQAAGRQTARCLHAGFWWELLFAYGCLPPMSAEKQRATFGLSCLFLFL